MENDIGDLTITYNDHETPQRLLALDRKGKGRESGDDHYSEDAQLYSQSTFDDGEEESQDSVAESQRIEAVRSNTSFACERSAVVELSQCFIYYLFNRTCVNGRRKKS